MLGDFFFKPLNNGVGARLTKLAQGTVFIGWLFILTLLSSCDTTSSSTQFDEGIRTGQFIDSAVDNIAYRTATQSGFTNSQGEYRYHDGEIVILSIGGIDFPGVTARRIVTPLTMVGVDTASDPTVLNISRLLLSLDVDADPDNGLQISDEAHRVAEEMALDFSAEDFDIAVINLVANSQSVTTSLVSAIAAQQHLEQQLDILPADSDGDDVIDTEDAFPNDPMESADSDGDGVGDNSDYAPQNPAVQTICQTEASGAEKAAAGCDNTNPIVQSFDAVTIGPLVSLELDSSLSYDPDGDNLDILWELVSQPASSIASINDADSANARFNGGNLEGEYVLRLTVTDSFGVQASSEWVVNVDKSLPGGLSMFISANMTMLAWMFLARRKRAHARVKRIVSF